MPEVVNERPKSDIFMPQFFVCSTEEILNRATELNVFKYPGICYVIETKKLAWMISEGNFQYIQGLDQYTDVQYKKDTGTFEFYSNGTLLKSVVFELPESQIQSIQNSIITICNNTYTKIEQFESLSDSVENLETLIESIQESITDINSDIQELNNKLTNLNYDTDIRNIPIPNIYSGSTPTVISSLNNGIYKIIGSYKITENSEPHGSVINPVLVNHKTGIDIIISSDSIKKYLVVGNEVFDYEFITEEDLNEIVEEIQRVEALIPTKMSQLENDLGFVKESDVDSIITEKVTEITTDIATEVAIEESERYVTENVDKISNEDINSIFNK